MLSAERKSEAKAEVKKTSAPEMLVNEEKDSSVLKWKNIITVPNWADPTTSDFHSRIEKGLNGDKRKMDLMESESVHYSAPHSPLKAKMCDMRYELIPKLLAQYQAQKMWWHASFLVFYSQTFLRQSRCVSKAECYKQAIYQALRADISFNESMQKLSKWDSSIVNMSLDDSLNIKLIEFKKEREDQLAKEMQRRLEEEKLMIKKAREEEEKRKLQEAKASQLSALEREELVSLKNMGFTSVRTIGLQPHNELKFYEDPRDGMLYAKWLKDKDTNYSYIIAKDLLDAARNKQYIASTCSGFFTPPSLLQITYKELTAQARTPEAQLALADEILQGRVIGGGRILPSRGFFCSLIAMRAGAGINDQSESQLKQFKQQLIDKLLEPHITSNPDACYLMALSFNNVSLGRKDDLKCSEYLLKAIKLGYRCDEYDPLYSKSLGLSSYHI